MSALAAVRTHDVSQLYEAASAMIFRDWAGLLARHPLEARKIARQFLQGRLLFTPKGDRYEVTGTASTYPIVEAVVPTLAATEVVAPTGFEPVFPHRRTLLPANQRLATC
jgi:hypothetical protein